MSNFIALEIYIIFGTKFSWNEGIGTCFNVECVLLGRNLLGDNCLVVTAGYCSLPGGYHWLLLVAWWLLQVTARYRSLLLVLSFTINHLLWNSIFNRLSKRARTWWVLCKIFYTAKVKNIRWHLTWNQSSVTHFSPLLHFYLPWKHQEALGFLKFSEDVEIKHLAEMGSK